MTKTLLSFIVLFGSFCAQSFAQTVAAPTAFDRFMELSTGSGKQTVGFSTNGTPVLSPGVPTVTADGGLPRVDASGSIRNPSGNPAAVTVTSRIPAAEVGKAVGRAALKVGASLAFVGTGLALFDLAKELGFFLKRDSSGGLVVEKSDPSVCTVAPCYQYSTAGAAYYASETLACQGYMNEHNAKGLSYTLSMTSSSPRCAFNAYWRFDGSSAGSDSTIYSTIAVEPSATAANFPSTTAELQAAVAFKSGWAAGSAVPRLIAEDNPPAGQKIQTGTPTLSGVATSAGTTTTTNNTTNNTTKTDTTTHNHTYQGNTVTTTNNVSSVTIDNSTGAVTNSTNTTSTPPAPAPEPDLSAADSPLPAVPKLYEPVYPKGFAGVWSDKKDQLKSAPLTALASSLMPNVASSGACPAMPVDLTFASWASFGVRDVAPPCYVWDWGKAFVILGALLLARALIFGG